MGFLHEGEWRLEGEWRTDSAPAGGGEFVRPASQFRQWIRRDTQSEFAAAPGRYHLYVSRACPWCHRTMIGRVLKQLENVISIGYVEPAMLENGWSFAQPDAITGARYVHEVYVLADPLYCGRATLPVLWDKQTHTIVNNESAEIFRIFNREFDDITDDLSDYYPPALAAEIDEINERLYATVNDGVYRAGFATTQAAYQGAVERLFESLAWLEQRLQQQRYLLGELLTEADWRLFATLVRFDAVYYAHFKCNLRHVYEYPALWAYTCELYQMPGIAQTVALDEYKAHYYGSHRNLNPTGIIPVGPRLDFTCAHGRGAAPQAHL
ncbi:MAG TPA: glutathione S-transferase family protein [Steroidobacteraceae bacterium]